MPTGRTPAVSVARRCATLAPSLGPLLSGRRISGPEATRPVATTSGSAPALSGQPPFPIRGQLGLRRSRVRLRSIGRLLGDAGTVAESRLVHRVRAPVVAPLALARADGQDDTRPVSRTDDDVLRSRWAVEEVPLTQRPLLSLDDKERLAGQHEKAFLVDLTVVQPHRSAGREHAQEDADLLELVLALELGAGRAAIPPPAGVARVQDEPPFRARQEPGGIGLHQRRLRYHELDPTPAGSSSISRL